MEVKSCDNCRSRCWAVGIGQGVFCLNEKNSELNQGYGLKKSGHPLLPIDGTTYVCKHHEEH